MSPWRSLVWLVLFSGAHGGGVCGPQASLVSPRGRIEAAGAPLNCSWTIAVPAPSVVVLRFERLQLAGAPEVSDAPCLSIRSFDGRLSYALVCADAVPFGALALPGNLLLSVEGAAAGHLALAYNSYVSACSLSQLRCFHGRVTGGACADGQLACDADCQLGSARCGAVCYDIDRQRCDGVLDCAAGEDELGCRPLECPAQVSCPGRPLCLRRAQICDGRPDCAGGFDESNCPPKEPPEISYIAAIALALLLLLFTYLTCRCWRRRPLLDNPLDVPLPPFQGPGEEAASTEAQPFSDADFRPGGDIYESFAANLAKIKGRRAQQEEAVTLVQPAQGQDALSKYFKGVRPTLSEEMAALASIKITRDRCHGLRKAKSEERPMTRLLFVDAQDQSGGSDDEPP